MNREKTKASKKRLTVAEQGRPKARWPWIALSILATGSTLAAYQVATYFGQASMFGLKAIEVDGLRRLNGEDVRAASGLAAGSNIFAIDLDEVVQRLEAMYWIKQAFVVRKPPDRIAVDIVEHRQVAWVDLGQTYGISPDGVLLPVGPTARNLPVISGLSIAAGSLQPGVAVPDSALLAILRWWGGGHSCGCGILSQCGRYPADGWDGHSLAVGGRRTRSALARKWSRPSAPHHSQADATRPSEPFRSGLH